MLSDEDIEWCRKEIAAIRQAAAQWSENEPELARDLHDTCDHCAAALEREEAKNDERQEKSPQEREGWALLFLQGEAIPPIQEMLAAFDGRCEVSAAEKG